MLPVKGGFFFFLHFFAQYEGNRHGMRKRKSIWQISAFGGSRAIVGGEAVPVFTPHVKASSCPFSSLGLWVCNIPPLEVSMRFLRAAEIAIKSSSFFFRLVSVSSQYEWNQPRGGQSQPSNFPPSEVQ